ncbi:hypothetical protein IMG5_191670 [Ichthyophthirius multifiliis]|uniref:Uncharacterized protein n=1 Tax=Ichthyophthirius multifiliis TaxID=5932 RepID=G0R4E5_ICHMU|nr:hypothetical protein IMG5_191670 [Ichthyophthirius multifiliis]EGR27664.1 hypothetical protein IMG5_191670 [Ichthyophthirius multifiliis]|eukprot:XP_004025116.1 hypothetical protein IMG5_191670 [Ichthyophthirius multifiliis]
MRIYNKEFLASPIDFILPSFPLKKDKQEACVNAYLKDINKISICNGKYVYKSNWNEEKEDFIIFPKQELKKIQEETQQQVISNSDPQSVVS